MYRCPAHPQRSQMDCSTRNSCNRALQQRNASSLGSKNSRRCFLAALHSRSTRKTSRGVKRRRGAWRHIEITRTASRCRILFLNSHENSQMGTTCTSPEQLSHVRQSCSSNMYVPTDPVGSANHCTVGIRIVTLCRLCR